MAEHGAHRREIPRCGQGRGANAFLRSARAARASPADSDQPAKIVSGSIGRYTDKRIATKNMPSGGHEVWIDGGYCELGVRDSTAPRLVSRHPRLSCLLVDDDAGARSTHRRGESVSGSPVEEVGGKAGRPTFGVEDSTRRSRARRAGPPGRPDSRIPGRQAPHLHIPTKIAEALRGSAGGGSSPVLASPPRHCERSEATSNE